MKRVFLAIFTLLTCSLLSGQSPYKLEMLKEEGSSYKLLSPGSAVTEGEDKCSVRLIKESDFTGTYYFTIIDIQPDGQINKIYPRKYGVQAEAKLSNESADTIFIEKLTLAFFPPYGKESFLLLLTQQPIQLAMGSRSDFGLNVLTAQDVKWIQLGMPPEELKNHYFSYQFDFEIRPKQGVKGSPTKGDYKNTGMDDDLDQNQYWLKKNQYKQAEIERIEREQKAKTDPNYQESNNQTVKILNRFEVPNDEIYTIYPVLTFLEPSEPSYTNAGMRGVKVTANPSKFETVVVKGTISCRQKVDMVEIWVQPDSGKKAIKYEITHFQQAPQSVIFETQVKIGAGKNLIEVIAVTTDKHAVRQQLEIEYKPEKSSNNGKSVLVCMAVNEYQHWSQLKNPISDANAFASVLTNHYGFDSQSVIKLYNADFTAKKVDSVFRLLIQNLGENDRIVVYYAGHGYYDDLMQEGYWIPANATTQESDYSTYISNAVISKYIKFLKTKHTLFITDACFSGSYFVDDKRGADKYTTQMNKYRSRWLFTSGRMELVADDYQKMGHSPFAYFLLNFLEDPNNSSFSISELANYVTKSVSNNGDQLPMARSIKNSGDEGGEFVFERRKNEILNK